MPLASFSPLSLLAPLLLLVLGAAQLTLWWRWRDRAELGWMGLGMGCSGLGMLLQVLHWPSSLVWHVLAFSSCYMAGIVATAHALALRLGVSMPWRAAGPIILSLWMAEVCFSVVWPDVRMRVYLFTLGAMLLMSLPLWHWRRMQVRNRFDRWLRAIYIACIGLNLLRTLWLMPVAGDAVSETFTRTWFWVAVHFSAMLCGLALVLGLVLAVVSDVIHGLQQDRNLDPLTRLLNRRAFHEQTRSLEQQQASKSWMLLVCDLDHFKWVNDTWGHAAGDGVLQVVADLLRRNVRDTDVVARFGGEEFVVLLADSHMTNAMQVAERIRRELSEIRLPMLVGERITMSIGVTAVKSLAPAHLQQAMALADQQLFMAKRAGRNRVRGPVPAPPPLPVTTEVRQKTATRSAVPTAELRP